MKRYLNLALAGLIVIFSFGAVKADEQNALEASLTEDEVRDTAAGLNRLVEEEEASGKVFGGDSTAGSTPTEYNGCSQER